MILLYPAFASLLRGARQLTDSSQGVIRPLIGPRAAHVAANVEGETSSRKLAAERNLGALLSQHQDWQRP